MFGKLFKKKQVKFEKRGKSFPFTFLYEPTMEYGYNKIMLIFKKEGKKGYWDYLKPYEIIDNNLCVRCCNNKDTGWIVLSKKELIDILEQIIKGENDE